MCGHRWVCQLTFLTQHKNEFAKAKILREAIVSQLVSSKHFSPTHTLLFPYNVYVAQMNQWLIREIRRHNVVSVHVGKFHNTWLCKKANKRTDVSPQTFRNGPRIQHVAQENNIVPDDSDVAVLFDSNFANRFIRVVLNFSQILLNCFMIKVSVNSAHLFVISNFTRVQSTMIARITTTVWESPEN